MFLAVILVGGENGDAVYLWKDDSQEHISSVMNTIILILHFQFFRYNRCILGFVFDIIPLFQLSIFGRLFVKRFSLCYRTVVCLSCPVCL